MRVAKGISCVIGHKKSEVIVSVDEGRSNSALIVAAKLLSTVSSVRLGKRNDRSEARRCVRYVSMSMLVFIKRS